MYSWAIVVASLAIPMGEEPCCCYTLEQVGCCIQVVDEWSIYCGGVPCVQAHQESGSAFLAYFAAPGQNGYSLVQSNVNENGSRCKYKKAVCDDGFCWLEPDWIWWNCHDQILTNPCQQPE